MQGGRVNRLQVVPKASGVYGALERSGTTVQLCLGCACRPSICMGSRSSEQRLVETEGLSCPHTHPSSVWPSADHVAIGKAGDKRWQPN